MGQDIQRGDKGQEGDQYDLDPVNQVDADHGQESNLEEVGEGKGKRSEIVRINTPSQYEPIDRT